MQSKPFHSAVALTLASLVLAASAVRAEGTLPTIQHEGKIDYISGGIGKDEAAAIQAEGRHWPLTLEFAVKSKNRAEYAADVKVAVRDAKKHADLQVQTDGPFLLLKLEPGTYRVDATLDGKTLSRQVQVASGHPAKLEFLWPAGT